ncbi:MAG TPA: formate/nitrite transporter [Clostridiales bacterium]|nr:formate/nitrite transporter [Clostridiales bacterium]
MVSRHLASGVAAGVLIGIGGAAYLACDSRYAGAALFTVGLLSVCLLGLSLFTGKVGFIVPDHRKESVRALLLCLPGNLIGAAATGLAISAATPARGEKALEICAAKLALPFMPAFILAVFCGVLMYLAVAIYREKESLLGVLFAVPAFILSGFEHSVADMFYFAAAGIVSGRAFLFILVVLLGNAAGGMLLPALRILAAEVRQNA